MVVHTFIPSIHEAKESGSLSLRPVSLQSKFLDSQCYTEIPCLEKNQNIRKKISP